jgi:hypothetical protein
MRCGPGERKIIYLRIHHRLQREVLDGAKLLKWSKSIQTMNSDLEKHTEENDFWLLIQVILSSHVSSRKTKSTNVANWHWKKYISFRFKLMSERNFSSFLNWIYFLNWKKISSPPSIAYMGSHINVWIKASVEAIC